MTTVAGAGPRGRTATVVAAGGAVGALLRWQVAGGLNGLAVGPCPGRVDCVASVPTFPWGTLLVNVVGALLLGVLARRQAGPLRQAFLGTGVLGAFTTFSAFAVEAVLLLRHRPLAGALHIAVTLVAGLVAARVGHGVPPDDAEVP